MKFKVFNELVVYDFDDTLLKTDAKIIIENKSKITRISPEEFSEYKKAIGDKFDFSEFHCDLINPKVTEFFKEVFVKDMSRNIDIVILTARGKKEPIIEFFYDFLPKIDYKFTKSELRLIEFVTIGGSAEEVPIKKRQWIEQQIYNYGYDKVTFYDDSQKNVDAVLELKKYWPNINIKVVKIDTNVYDK